jgi:hypothetical protein
VKQSWAGKQLPAQLCFYVEYQSAEIGLLCASVLKYAFKTTRRSFISHEENV